MRGRYTVLPNTNETEILQKGDEVLLRNHSLRKSAPKWHGPYTVLGVNSPHEITIEHYGKQSISNTKKYYDSTDCEEIEESTTTTQQQKQKVGW